MQIQLCEDDGLFHDGIPTLVVLVIKFDDGKTKRIPYPADRTISALYEDLNSIAPQVAELPQEPINDFEKTYRETVNVLANRIQRNEALEANKNNSKIDKSNIIEKEDIVTMVKMHERDKGATCDLIVGNDYRVMECIGPRVTLPGRNDITQMIEGYDVIDDHAPIQRRLRVFPDEIVLKSKRLSKIIEKVIAVEEILPCPYCQKSLSLVLEGTDFVGNCENCKDIKQTKEDVEIRIARIIKKCLTAKCGQEVSCFDVGGKYQGACIKCKANVEVPYA